MAKQDPIKVNLDDRHLTKEIWVLKEQIRQNTRVIETLNYNLVEFVKLMKQNNYIKDEENE